MSLQIKILEKYEDGIAIIELKNEYLSVRLSNLGCNIMSIIMRDKENKYSDIVLGFDDIEDYKTQDKYFGALIGRVANRIGNGKFELNGDKYILPVNDSVNHLHGGLEGFDKKIFGFEILENGIEFYYLSKDGEEGYPGNLNLVVKYTLNKETLKVEYTGVCDKDTVINITNHSYFNLSGDFENICDHYLKIKSDYISKIDENGLTIGELMKVENTPFDFNEYHQIGERIEESHEQISLGQGYDHPFIFKCEENQIELYHERTGRKLTISTSLPGAQLYSSNFLDGRTKGKNGIYYNYRSGVCLETQMLPNSINIEGNSDTILRKGEKYNSYTEYKFEVLR